MAEGYDAAPFLDTLPAAAEAAWGRLQSANEDAPGHHALLDTTIRQLGSEFVAASGLKGKAGIAFIVASGDDADRLSKYIKRHWHRQ